MRHKSLLHLATFASQTSLYARLTLICKPENLFINQFAMSVTTPNEYDVEAKLTMIGPTSLQ